MATRTKRTTGCPSCGRPDCRDARCRGLECLERPRFFSGQLLTEGELNSEQAYVLAKNRLHNLHLHGWGVVCGLEVTCHDCDGWVTVHPGYAIDSCGNDVIVCCPHDFDVAGEIERCKRERGKGDCYCPPQKNCNDQGEEHWCITLSYQEKEARPMATLHQQDGPCGCGPGCKCGGAKHGDACTCKPTRAERAKAGVGKVPYACEPTRILESYRLEVCESGEENCFTKKSKGEQAWIDKFTACLTNLKRSLRKLPLEGTLRLGKNTLASNGVSMTPGVSGPQPLPPAQVYRDFCDLKDFLIDLLKNSPGNLHCALVAQLEALECRQPGPNDTFDTYWGANQLSAQRLLGILLLYLKDCFCHALLPPCGPCCPGEEPLVLACVTVKNGKILEICNYNCRRWAGAFPPSMFGVYLGPIWPLVAKLIGIFCCGDFLDRFLRTTKRQRWAQRIANFALGSDFANAGFAVNESTSFWKRAAHEPEQAPEVEVTHFLGQRTEVALATAEKAGLALTIREVGKERFADRWAALRSAKPGDSLVGFAREGKIVGFAREGSAEVAVVEQANELASLRREVDALKVAIQQRPGGPNG